MSVPIFRSWSLRSVLTVVFLCVGVLLAVALPLKRSASREGHLAFEKSDIAQTATPSQTEIIARFPFQNDGDKPIKILEVKTDCDCTVATPGKNTFAAGERGEIVVKFTIGVRTGLQRKGVVVLTDHPAQAALPLSLIVTIPEVVTLPKSLLLWTEQESPEPKSLVVKTSENPPVRELRARTDSPYLTVTVERVKATEFLLHVTPMPNRHDISAAVQIEAVLDNNQRKLVNAFVRVR